jgi:hypothetical protein
MQKPQVATIAVLSTAETETLLVAPHGLDEIITAFGNIYDDVGKDGQLEALSTGFPGASGLAVSAPAVVGPVANITQMTCHKRMTRVFGSVFGRIQERGLPATQPAANCRPTAGALRLT